jgi:hypothetical protein
LLLKVVQSIPTPETELMYWISSIQPFGPRSMMSERCSQELVDLPRHSEQILGPRYTQVDSDLPGNLPPILHEVVVRYKGAQKSACGALGLEIVLEPKQERMGLRKSIPALERSGNLKWLAKGVQGKNVAVQLGERARPKWDETAHARILDGEHASWRELTIDDARQSVDICSTHRTVHPSGRQR